MPNTLAGLEQFTALGSASVTAGGNTTPAAGTSESWTLASSSLPGASNSANPPTGFYVADPAQPTEVMLVTNISGATATVVRGADGTTPVAHVPTFTVVQVASGNSFQALQGTQLATPAAGTALINGTATFISWTAPNDGLIHRFTWSAILHVTTLEVGGAVTCNFTDPAGVAASSTVFAAAQAAGEFGNSLDRLCQANTTVTISQAALTGGASTIYIRFRGD